MIEKLLANYLRPVLDAEINLRRRRVVIGLLCGGSIAFLALSAISASTGWWSWPVVFALLGFLLLAGVVGLVRAGREPDWKEMASRIESHHPDLRAALLTAIDQKPGADGRLSFLQRRLLSQVSEHAIRNRWVRRVSSKRLRLSAWGQFASIVGFIVATWFLLGYAPDVRNSIAVPKIAGGETTPRPGEIEIEVSPGDVELEKGSRLVVETIFSGRAPASAQLVLRTAEEERVIPMTVGLDDHVFSALVPRIEESGDYRVRFEDRASDTFGIDVFEFPALEQADATVTPPAFLEEEPEIIEDTRKITVMEGSHVEWRMRINKPIAKAKLVGEDRTEIPLQASPDADTQLVGEHMPSRSQRYRLELLDHDQRGNARPPAIQVNVKRNRPPQLKLLFPGRDFEVSAVQELPLEARVWDDVSVEAVGLAYQYGDEETSITLSEDPLPGGRKHVVSQSVDLEPLEAEPRDLLTYYFWAEDRDNEGNVRRTTSDMFFAEVRFFEEIMREGAPQQGGGQGGQQNQADELLKLQKEVINAAWTLRRYHDLGRPLETLAPDVDVVQESQIVVLSRLEPVLAMVSDEELKRIYEEARTLMEKSAEAFAAVNREQDGDLIDPAHQAARAVFAKLIEARSREQQISLSNDASGSGSQQQQQRNMNLELEQKNLKYEETSQAQQQQQTEEQQENLAVLSRLKELARRQEAIAEKIRDLQNQLDDADEEERADIQRRLKRLEEEQRELLREVDDLSERMDSEQNRPNMAEQREELEETRENVRETAEELADGNLSDAATSATRASRELDEIEDEFRERTSRRFAEEMRQLRDGARQLSEAQEGIAEQLEEMNSGEQSRDPFSSESQKRRTELARNLSAQSDELEGLVEEMKRLSEESETSEPILSDSLYEAVRETMTSGAAESLEEARDMTYYNRPSQALTAQQAAARGIEDLREAIEEAAEKVLGNEADALRMARSELDQLIDQSRDEARRLANESGEPDPSGAGESREGEQGESRPGTGPGEDERAKEPSESLAGGGGSSPGEEQPEGAQGTRPGSGEGDSPEGSSAEGQQPGESLASNESGQPGQGQPSPEESDQPGSGSPEGEGQSGTGQQPGEGGQEGQEGRQAGTQQGSAEDPTLLTQGQNGSSPGQGQDGSQPGPGQGQSDSPSPSEQGEGGQSPGQGSGGQQASAQGGQPGESDQPGDGESSSAQAGASDSGRRGGLSMGGEARGGAMPTGGSVGNQPLFFNQQSERREPGPITGEDYSDFRDRLGNIEEMLQQEELRNAAARVADNARAMRIDYSRDNLPPGAATIDQRITQPLVELRQRVSEEIARLNRENPIAPVDRDPVPSEFRDLVRRYYEELGSGN